MPDKIKLIIFDLDGTLVDAYGAIIRSFNFSLQKLGYPKQKDLAIRRAVGWGDEKLLEPFIRPRDLKRAVAIYRKQHKKDLIKYSCLLPGAKKVLGRLKDKGYKLAVASNRPIQFSLILIAHLGLDRYFDFMLCADKLRRAKPHPDMLRKIMLKFSVKPKEAVYVGDMALDAQAGRRAGVKAVIVTTGSSAESEIKQERPFRVIRRLTGLLRLL